MPRRTLTFARIEIRESHITKSEFMLDDIKGLSILDEFETWLSNVPLDHFDERVKLRYGKKPKVKRRNRIVIASMRTGHYGISGNEVINVSDHSTAYQTNRLDASTVETRCGLLVPPGATTALLFVEHEGHNDCGFRIFDSFKAHLKSWALENHTGKRGKPLKLTIEMSTVVSGPDWLKNAEMQDLTVHCNRRPTDVSDEVPAHFNLAYSQTLSPMKGQRFLPPKFKKMVFNGGIRSAAALGFPIDDDYDSLITTVSDGERTKRIEVGNPRFPSIRTLLNEDGEDHLKMSGLIDIIDAEAKAFYESLRLDYDLQWTRKQRR